MATVIPIRPSTKEMLDQIKQDEDHTSYDSLIKALLTKGGYDKKKAV